MKEQYRQAQEAVAGVADDLKEEVKERAALSSRLRSEAEERTKVISAVWLEVANIQQQMVEARQAFQGEAQKQSKSMETRHENMKISLEAWQDKLDAAFHRHKSDVSALRDHMTDHMSWVASAHETA